ncbi:MAG: T9SS type A sorting domain-containing protein [Flavobacteriales bacterium]
MSCLSLISVTSTLVLCSNVQAQNHCKVRYLYSNTGDRIQRDWYCWDPHVITEKEEDAEPKVLASSMEELHLQVAPNPASEQLSIMVPSEFASGTIDLLSPTGALMATTTVTSTRTTFDVSNFSSGHYFIRFVRGDETIISPCIVQR